MCCIRPAGPRVRRDRESLTASGSWSWTSEPPAEHIQCHLRRLPLHRRPVAGEPEAAGPPPPRGGDPPEDGAPPPLPRPPPRPPPARGGPPPPRPRRRAEAAGPPPPARGAARAPRPPD